MEAILGAAIPPIVAALFAAFGVWLQRRNRHNRRRQAVTDAKEMIAVISSWLEAHQKLAGPEHQAIARDRALADLNRAYALFALTQEAARREQGVSGFRALVDSIFLLDTRPSSAVAKTVRVLYYVSLAWVGIWVAAALMFGVAGAALETSETSSSLAARLAIAFGISVLCLAVGLSPALVLYLIYRSSTTRMDQNRATWSSSLRVGEHQRR